MTGVNSAASNRSRSAASNRSQASSYPRQPEWSLRRLGGCWYQRPVVSRL